MNINKFENSKKFRIPLFKYDENRSELELIRGAIQILTEGSYYKYKYATMEGTPESECSPLHKRAITFSLIGALIRSQGRRKHGSILRLVLERIDGEIELHTSAIKQSGFLSWAQWNEWGDLPLEERITQWELWALSQEKDHILKFLAPLERRFDYERRRDTLVH